MGITCFKRPIVKPDTPFATFFYVHGETLIDKAMLVFTDDMKAIGRNDLGERVHTVQHQAALLESGHGDYWIILPDKTAMGLCERTLSSSRVEVPGKSDFRYVWSAALLQAKSENSR